MINPHHQPSPAINKVAPQYGGTTTVGGGETDLELIYEDLSALDTLLTVVVRYYAHILGEQSPETNGYQYYAYLKDARHAISELSKKCSRPEYAKKILEVSPHVEERLKLFELIIEYSVAMDFTHSDTTFLTTKALGLSYDFLKNAGSSSLFDYCKNVISGIYSKSSQTVDQIQKMLNDRDDFLIDNQLSVLTSAHPLIGVISLFIEASGQFISDRVNKSKAQPQSEFGTKEWLLLYTSLAFQAYSKSWQQGGGGMTQLQCCLLSHRAVHSLRPHNLTNIDPMQLKAMVDFLVSALVQCENLETYTKKYADSLSQRTLNQRMSKFLRESIDLYPNPVYLRPDLKHVSKSVINNALNRIPSLANGESNRVLDNVMRHV